MHVLITRRQHFRMRGFKGGMSNTVNCRCLQTVRRMEIHPFDVARDYPWEQDCNFVFTIFVNSQLVEFSRISFSDEVMDFSKDLFCFPLLKKWLRFTRLLGVLQVETVRSRLWAIYDHKYLENLYLVELILILICFVFAAKSTPTNS